MSLYGEPSLADLLPAYYCNNYRAANRRQACSSIWKGIFTHVVAMITAVSLYLGGYYYYHNIYIPNQNFSMVEESARIQKRADIMGTILKSEPIDSSNVRSSTEDINRQINEIKKDLAAAYHWRSTVNSQLTKIHWERDITIKNAIEHALAMYEADRIGEMDYAASYAGGMIVGFSKETTPHPTHRPISLFEIVKVEVLSSPEEVIRPCLLPGSCFAFRGDSGSIRIRLGKPINIGRVTLSHASRLLLGLDDMNSAPKEFEIYGFTDAADQTGTFLGRYTFNLMGEQHQTFAVRNNSAKHQIFEEVELTILSNYGKEEFTCIYRFRVHRGNASNTERFTQTTEKDSKKCC